MPLLLGVLLVASILEDHIMHDGLTMRLKRCIYGIGCFYFIFLPSFKCFIKEREEAITEFQNASHIGEIDYFIHYATGTIFPIWCTDDDGSKCIRDAIIFEVVEACLFFFAWLLTVGCAILKI